MTQRNFTIGFVGVGRMGANMARRLKDHAYPIAAVYDTAPGLADALAKELGCEAAGTPARVAELSNTVMTVVTDDRAMRQIYRTGGTDSLLAHAAGRLFINCATVSAKVHIVIEAK